ncbi:unnamed protein product [Linum tenue]|uniref:Exocyst subunit Exo70 family protein n=1 Tax=Linum tenue TaxID=586396 RepID=A0AAV0PVS2_9ROSI|nr:unnamed protein product [Linum tenue]CAI0475120.1 unnamed protein product [Linum tenue]
MQKAMKRLEKEFYLILRASRSSTVSDEDESDGDETATEPSQFGDDVPSASSVAMADLNAIAHCMIGAGYTKECVKIYKIIRKSIVDEGLYRLGVDRFSLLQVHKLDWEAVDSKIKTWLYAVKVAVKTLFYGERLLCDHVFSSSSPAIRESCFVEVVREGALDLFGFPENFAKGKKTLEKMFRTLDIYEAISDLWPDIESIFSFESTAAVRNRAINSLIKLGDAVRTMLADLENSITKDASKISVPGGGVHPLTRGVTSPVSVRLAWLILILLCKLDGKAQFYRDVPLSYLFLANNLRYVVNKVRTSSLKFHLGDEWIEKHDAKVRQYAANYERVGWDRVMSSLPANAAAAMTVPEAAEWFRKFNSAFEEAYRKQSSWVVPDSRLRDEIKISVARKIGPAYRRFYERNRAAVSRQAGSHGIVRYAPDDLENYWSDLFYGPSGGSFSSGSSSRSSVSSSGHGGSSH